MTTFVIKVNGEAVPNELLILSIHIDKGLKRNSSARIMIADGDRNTGKFEVSSSDTFLPGKEISIEAGDDQPGKILFKGVIKGQSIRIDPQEGAQIGIECSNAAASIRKPAADPRSVCTVSYGDNLLAFNAEIGSVNPVGDGTAAGSYEYGSIVGQADFLGTSVIEPGNYITIQGVGDRFSGDHLVSGVVHSLGDGNWFTSVSIGIPIVSPIRTIQDENGNSMTLSPEGITLKSSGTISIEAGTMINVNGTQGITVKSPGGDVLTNAVNIRETAELIYSAAGSEIAEVKSGMQLTLKSAMILIN